MFPCLPRAPGAKPHVQVGKNQNIELGWATGHGGSSYWVLVHEKDSDKLAMHRNPLIEDYLASAPAGSNQAAPGQPRQRMHRSVYGTKTDPAAFDFWQKMQPSDSGAFNYLGYKGPMAKTDPRYPGKQPYVPGVTGNLGNTMTPNRGSLRLPADYPLPAGKEFNREFLWEYKDADIMNDRYVAYSNPKYPWILAAAKYAHVQKPADVDVAMMAIPADNNFGAGNYVAQWLWNGYYDCVDISYTDSPTPTPTPFGVKITANGGKAFTKIDHCFFPDPKFVWGQAMEVVKSVDACHAKCLTSTSGGNSCDGVAVVPFNTPMSSNLKGTFLQNPLIKNILDKTFTVSATNIPIPAQTAAQLLTAKNNINTKAAGNADLLVCILLTARAPSQDNTVGKYEIVTDPEHPYFYSTCHDLQQGVIIPPLPAAGAGAKSGALPSWKFANNCIACDDAMSNQMSSAPLWKVADQCTNCDLMM